MDVLDPSLVLAPYLEPVVRGRRVVVFGDSTGTLGPGLLERGARLVHIYDPDAVRAAESAARRGASRTLVIAPLPDGDLAVREGAFDAAIVPDLGVFDSPDDVIGRARRLVSSSGVAVFATPNPDCGQKRRSPARPNLLSYYELFDAVALQFPDVRMFGQAPFAGYVIADFAPDDEPDVVVDTSLLDQGAEEPRFYIAVASRSRPQLDPYAIIQVPQTLVRAEAMLDEGEQAQARQAQDLAARVAPLETELSGTRARIRELEAVARVAERVPELQGELDKRAEQLRKAEARSGDVHVRAGQLENKVRDLEEELRTQRERAFRLSNELEEERKRGTKAALELGMIRRTSELPAKPEVARPEDLARIKALDAELDAAQQTAANLQVQLDGARARIAELQARVVELEDELEDQRAIDKQAARRLAELEAELRERSARIEQLDALVLELNSSTARSDDESQRQLVAAIEERDAALAALDSPRKEQEAEIDALESRLRDQGRELGAAKDEIARREQIVRELLMMLEEAKGAGLPVDSVAGAPDGDLRVQLDQLAARCASKEAELQQASWRIDELEQKLPMLSSPEPSAQVEDLEAALFDAHNELDALRTSLRLEHAARETLEAEVAQAREQAGAELQEQAVLLASTGADSDGEPGGG